MCYGESFWEILLRESCVMPECADILILSDKGSFKEEAMKKYNIRFDTEMKKGVKYDIVICRSDEIYFCKNAVKTGGLIVVTNGQNSEIQRCKGLFIINILNL